MCVPSLSVTRIIAFSERKSFVVGGLKSIWVVILVREAGKFGLSYQTKWLARCTQEKTSLTSH